MATQMHIPTVFVFDNGNIAVTDEYGEQIVELQRESVVQMICNKIEKAGLDPTKFDFRLPQGTARVFKTENGWNWGFGRTYQNT